MNDLRQPDRTGAMPLTPITGIISDLDGVVFRGSAPIASAVEAFERWAARGLPYCFVTNNSTRTPEDVSAKLAAMGVMAPSERIVTSTIAAVGILRSRWPSGGRAYVVGAPSLIDAVEAAGFQLAEAGAADCVVVGLDRTFTYDKLNRAARLVRDGAALIGTNPDLMLPAPDGFDPGNGSILAAIAAASRATATIAGKPERHIVDEAVRRLGIAREGMVMIGDQLETDIISGQSAGLFSILVRTGVPDRGISAVKPDLIIDGLIEIDELEARIA